MAATPMVQGLTGTQLDHILRDPKHPMYTQTAIALAKGMKALPVSVMKALPAFRAAGYSVQDLSKYLMQPSRIYDILPWGAAGVGSPVYTFFQRAAGSGTVTTEDTNMAQQGNIGQNNAFVITSIGFTFLSGLRPVITGAAGTIAVANRVNDFIDVMQRGVAQFSVNGVGQLFNAGVAPLMGIPANEFFLVGGAPSSGTAADMLMGSVEIVGDGLNFYDTPITLAGGAPFNATVSFPRGVITLQSANAASYIACYLDGYALRPAG